MKKIKSISKYLKPPKMDEELQLFEVELQQTLIPVKPQAQFVSNLRKSLLNQMPSMDLTPRHPQHQLLKTGLLVSGGIIGSLFVVMTGIRGFISIVGFIGLLISWNKQYLQESFTPSNLTQG